MTSQFVITPIQGSSYLAISEQSLRPHIRYTLRRTLGKIITIPHMYKRVAHHRNVYQDTWGTYPGQTTEQSRVTHGTFFYLAQEEGLLGNNSIHGGIRCKLAVSSRSNAKVNGDDLSLVCL